MNADQQKFHDKMPKLYRANYKKAVSGKSKAAALKAKCLDCCCWQRTEIVDCRVPDCPLYQYRPYRIKSKPKKPLPEGVLEN